MNKLKDKVCSLLSLFFLVGLVSCGSLKIAPQGCRSTGVWGTMVAEGKTTEELVLTESFFVWNLDHQVRLVDFLKEHKIECRDVKSLRVQVKSSFFVKRDLTVFVQK